MEWNISFTFIITSVCLSKFSNNTNLLDKFFPFSHSILQPNNNLQQFLKIELLLKGDFSSKTEHVLNLLNYVCFFVKNFKYVKKNFLFIYLKFLLLFIQKRSLAYLYQVPKIGRMMVESLVFWNKIFLSLFCCKEQSFCLFCL